MNRERLIDRLDASSEPWDIVVVGGGATGLGAAVDAAARGYRTLLLEQSDFAKATSSRSTKLVHGGVRYLEQLNFSLVSEALRERGLLYENAPHLVSNLGFVVPRFKWWEGPFYGVGLKLYDALAGSENLTPSRGLDREATIAAIPNVEQDGLQGGVMYHDAQFDDARMAMTLALTAADLWPGKGWNFVFGQASLRDRVGVWSLYRNGDPDKDKASYQLCLKRTIKTAVHETGHMFSILHCTAWECCMNGSNTREESDRHPLWFCPECNAKVCWATRVDPVPRYRKTVEVCKKLGFEEERAFYEKSLARLAE